MSEFNQTLLIALLTRLLGVACGTVFAFLGYKLFAKGFFEKASELNAIWGKQRLVLKQIGPGVFFALLGVAVIWVTSQHPMQVSDKTTRHRSLSTSEFSQREASIAPASLRLPLCEPQLKASAMKLRDNNKLSRSEAYQLADCIIEAVETRDTPILEKEVREHLGYTRPGEIVYTMPANKTAPKMPEKKSGQVPQGTDLK